MKNSDIMMVKTNITSDEYIVKSHLGEEKVYPNIIKVPNRIINWMDKHTQSHDTKGNIFWI